jgi:hypothetical protein
MIILYASSELQLTALSCEDIGLYGSVRVVVAGSNNNLRISLIYLHINDSSRTGPFKRSQNPGALEDAALKLGSTRTIGAQEGAEANVAFKGLNQFAVCIGKCHIRVVLLLIKEH